MPALGKDKSQIYPLCFAPGPKSLLAPEEKSSVRLLLQTLVSSLYGTEGPEGDGAAKLRLRVWNPHDKISDLYCAHLLLH